ncbi:uncharacterized protein CEXT_620691 [Caerostris extrusa]|uniref:Uncharacterized protein n=1 Tax=Caerostris extrusa TaxID=172846 RepID=A0AAV4NGV8_CAEEX|nr:uncharacterized protein CEXT_620691 [Caerostris extrusa]
MEPRTLVSSQNGDSRNFTLNPELRKITHLGEKIKKSPSWPSSPTTPRKHLETPFWTLGRRDISRHKRSDEQDEFHKKSSDDAFKEIHSILSNMDLGKYYFRGPKEVLSSSNNFHFGNVPQTNKKSFLDDIPPPPKTKSMLEKSTLPENKGVEKIYALELNPIQIPSRQVNSKLRELTERLRPSSAPPSPHRTPRYPVPRSAPPMSNFSFWKDPLPIENPFILPFIPKDTAFKNQDLSKDIALKFKDGKLSRKKNVDSYATLPRSKVLEPSNEPRTLACLDLNINFQPYRDRKTFFDDDDRNDEHRDKKDFDNKEDPAQSNENSFVKKSDNDDVQESYRDKRENTLSRNNSISSKKADFDLNFRKRSLCGIQIFDKDPSSSIDDESAKTSHDSASPPSHSDGSKSVSALPQSFSNPLEEDIRTIAKILQGKETLFYKLIQSSKIESEASKQAINSYKTALTAELPGHAEKSQSATTQRQRERGSPTRTRAMTVPGAEQGRNVSPTSPVSPPAQQKRFYKKKLRGPYGEMLEQEMSKSFNKPRPSYAKDLEFLKELENPAAPEQKSGRTLLRSSSHSFDETHSIVVDNAPKRKTSANIPIVRDNELRVPTTSVSGTVSEPTLHIRSHSDSVKTSSSWNVDNLIAKVLKQSAQQVSTV